ncbi:MAG: thioredoxin [Acidimicrobiales bacterium]|jgi:thioredoxin 1|nr:thioredoxin [Acidimicrobiales bacterium]
MATVELTKDNFEAIVRGNDVVFVDFWAEWCGPCRMFGPVFEAASAEHPDLVFAKVNTEEQPELAGAFNVMSIPTLMAFREQVVLYAEPGALPAKHFGELIEQVMAVDMDEVHREIAERHADHDHDHDQSH